MSKIIRKTILLTGGAGYIGSHAAYLLAKQGHRVIILDNFSHSQKFDHSWAEIIKADFADTGILDKIFKTNNIDAVMHFAAHIEVGESVRHPQLFYNNNVIKTLTLLDAMLKYNVKTLIFSSSCAVYGEPVKIPMDESHSYNPISPYGKNKLMVEFALQDYAQAYGLKYVSLRYFNAAGGLPNEGLGEQHDPETHLIPLMLRSIKNNKPFKIFGTDYDTPDGSCIRDYIHVIDIANAHVLALDYLEATGQPEAFNLGSGQGFSVKEMVHAVEKICKKKMIIAHKARRHGDPATLLADPTKAKTILGWKPQYSDIDTILQSAFTWEKKRAIDAETFSQVQPCSSTTSSAGREHK